MITIDCRASCNATDRLYRCLLGEDMKKYIILLVLLLTLATSYQNGDVVGELIKFSACGLFTYLALKFAPLDT